MVLNMLSTASMVRLGRVYENWMIHVALTNQKLRRRGARILEEAAGVSPSAAEHALRQAGHNLPAGARDAENGRQRARGTTMAGENQVAMCGRRLTHEQSSAREQAKGSQGNRHGPIQNSRRAQTRRHRPNQRRKKRRAAGDGRGAAHRRTGAPAKYSARARHHHHGQAARAHALPRGKPGPSAERIHHSGGNRFARTKRPTNS